MTQRVDLRDFVEDEYCEDVKEVASKVGVQVVCNDEDSEAEDRRMRSMFRISTAATMLLKLLPSLVCRLSATTKNNVLCSMKGSRGFGAFFVYLRRVFYAGDARIVRWAVCAGG